MSDLQDKKELQELRKAVKALALKNVSAGYVTKMSKDELQSLIDANPSAPKDDEKAVETIVSSESFTTKKSVVVPVIRAEFVAMSPSKLSFQFKYKNNIVTCSNDALKELHKAGYMKAGDIFTFKAELVTDVRYEYPLVSLLASANEIVLAQLDITRENDIALAEHLNKIDRLKVSVEAKIASQKDAIGSFYPTPEPRKLVLKRD